MDNIVYQIRQALLPISPSDLTYQVDVRLSSTADLSRPQLDVLESMDEVVPI